MRQWGGDDCANWNYARTISEKVVIIVPFGIRAETHLAACVQRNPVHSNQIHASIVYCADLAIYTSDM